MTRRRPACPPALLAAAMRLPLTACTSDTSNYPSLARRDVERAAASPAPNPSPTTSPAPIDPEVAAKLPKAIAEAREAEDRFAAARPGAERAVAAGAGAAPGSEGWAVASIALASLESARSQAMIALADLDALYAEARVNGAGGQSEIVAARDQVSAIIGAQDEVLATLRGRMGG